MLLVGKEYGTGSSRDWAAKGTTLLGVKAVIAESYERIHRSNLVGHGRAAARLRAGRDARQSLGLTGRETFTITGIAKGLTPAAGHRHGATPGARTARRSRFQAVVRLNSTVEVDYYRHGGILQRVLRKFAAEVRRGSGEAGKRGRMQNDLPDFREVVRFRALRSGAGSRPPGPAAARRFRPRAA